MYACNDLTSNSVDPYAPPSNFVDPYAPPSTPRNFVDPYAPPPSLISPVRGIGGSASIGRARVAGHPAIAGAAEAEMAANRQR